MSRDIESRRCQIMRRVCSQPATYSLSKCRVNDQEALSIDIGFAQGHNGFLELSTEDTESGFLNSSQSCRCHVSALTESLMELRNKCPLTFAYTLMSWLPVTRFDCLSVCFPDPESLQIRNSIATLTSVRSLRNIAIVHHNA